MIINLLSNPRNVSTALMYSFAQRPDCGVLDEPYYAWYLGQTGEDHPMRSEILQSLPKTERGVIKLIEAQAEASQHLFLKNMAHHVRGIDWSVFSKHHNLLFIRHPSEVLASFSKVIDRPQLKDIAIRDQYDLWQYFNANDIGCTVLDAGDLLKDPEKMLARLCEKIGLAFEPAMLAWPSGAKEFDGVWAPAWYGNVHRSTGFVERGHFGSNPLSADLEQITEEAMKYYAPLFNARLK